MIDTNSIITIIIAGAIIYFIIKFIISPVLKIISGIIIFLLAIYILQKYFGFSFNQYMGPLARYVDLDKITNSLTWIISPIMSYVEKAIIFFKYLLSNTPQGK